MVGMPYFFWFSGGYVVQNLQGTRASPPMATSCLLRETLKTSPTSWIRNPNQVNGKSRVLKWRYVSTLYIYGRYLQFRFLQWPLINIFFGWIVLLVLGREWMGMGFAGRIIPYSDYGSFRHSLLSTSKSSGPQPHQ